MPVRKKERVVVVMCSAGCDENIIDPYCKVFSLYCLDKMKEGSMIRAITTGTYTNPVNFPGVSASKLARTVLNGYGLNLVKIKAENLSETLAENLEQVELILRGWARRGEDYRFDKVVVFCDSAQKACVKVMAKILIGMAYNVPVEVIGYRFGHNRQTISALRAKAVVEQICVIARYIELKKTQKVFKKFSSI